MRIIAGQWRGRPLITPKGDATRPTADRTREGLFSMLVSRVGSFEGLNVGDFFAGSGALGLEALSRGAASCLFVEQDRAAVDAIRTNADKFGRLLQTFGPKLHTHLGEILVTRNLVSGIDTDASMYLTGPAIIVDDDFDLPSVDTASRVDLLGQHFDRSFLGIPEE